MFSSKSRFTMKYAPLEQQETINYTSAFTYGSGSHGLPTKTEPRDWIFNKKSKKLYQVPAEQFKDETISTPMSVKLLYLLFQAVSYLFCFITLPFSLFATVKMVRQYERILVFRLGRLSGIKGPGLVAILPCIDKWNRVDLRTKAFHIPPTSLSTKDGGVISVGAMVYFRISDPVKMSLSVSDINKSVRHVAQSCMSSLLCKKTFDVIVNKRLNLSYDLQVDINMAANDWGAEVSSVELSDINLLVKPKQAPHHHQQQQQGDMFGGGGNQLFSSFANIAQQVMTHVQREDEVTDKPSSNTSVNLDEIVARIESCLSADLVSKVGVIYLFTIIDESGGERKYFILDLKNGGGSIAQVASDDADADVLVQLSAKTLDDIITKKVSMLTAYSSGSLKLSGSISDAAKLSNLSNVLEAQ